MKKSNKTFGWDPRNIGGRTQIVELMTNHQSSLRRIRPVLCITAPHPHVDSTRPRRSCLPGNGRDPKYAMVRATYRTISEMKRGLVNRSVPTTFELIDKLSANKKNNKHAVVEHIKNMTSLQSRLRRIETGNVYPQLHLAPT